MEMKIKKREELEEGELICFVGVHVLRWERYMREYGIPDFDFAFIKEEEISKNSDD